MKQREGFLLTTFFPIYVPYMALSEWDDLSLIYAIKTQRN